MSKAIIIAIEMIKLQIIVQLREYLQYNQTNRMKFKCLMNLISSNQVYKIH